MDTETSGGQPGRPPDTGSANFALQICSCRLPMCGPHRPPGHMAMAACHGNPRSIITVCCANPWDMTDEEIVSQAHRAGNELGFQLDEMHLQQEPIGNHWLSHADIRMDRACRQGALAAIPMTILGAALTILGQNPLLALLITVIPTTMPPVVPLVVMPTGARPGPPTKNLGPSVPSQRDDQ